MEINQTDIVRVLDRFTGVDLTETLGRLEDGARGVTAENCGAFIERTRASRKALAAAAELKRLAGQINVTIHALEILLCLPHILELGETVEYVSLGAGNTGRQFDLETNLRVAEFKFIAGAGGRKRYARTRHSRISICWRRTRLRSVSTCTFWVRNTL